MGQSEAATEDRPVMATTHNEQAEAGGATRWNHVKTFALVGVSALIPLLWQSLWTDQPLTRLSSVCSFVN